MPTETVIIAWEEPASALKPKNNERLIWLGLIGLGLFLLALFLKNILLALIVAIGSLTLILLGRKPQTTLGHYAIMNHGIRIDDHLYPYESLHSFSVGEKFGRPMLKLRSEKIFLPYLNLPLPSNEAAEAIKEVLLAFLEEGRHDETLVDMVSDYLSS